MKVPIFVIFIVLEKRDISSILFHIWCAKYVRSSGLRTGFFAYVKKNLPYRGEGHIDRARIKIVKKSEKVYNYANKYIIIVDGS